MKILKQSYPVAAQAVPTKRYCQTLDLREDPELIAAYKSCTPRKVFGRRH